MPKVAIVTGGARGLGAAISKRLAQDGFAIAIVDLNPEGAAATAGEIVAAGGKAESFVANVADEPDVNRVVAEIAGRMGQIGVLVNNAGISPKHGGRKAKVVDMEVEEWRQVMEINLTSAFLMNKACVPFMLEHKWGRIISMSSEAGRTLVPFVSGAHYAASKAGIIALSWVLAEEVAEFGITVNCVAPGRARTPMSSMATSEVAQIYESAIPMKRVGTPEEMAAAVAFLASEGAAFITGATIDVNGGHAML